jgi:hypothetical protein
LGRLIVSVLAQPFVAVALSNVRFPRYFEPSPSLAAQALSLLRYQRDLLRSPSRFGLGLLSFAVVPGLAVGSHWGAWEGTCVQLRTRRYCSAFTLVIIVTFVILSLHRFPCFFIGYSCSASFIPSSLLPNFYVVIMITLLPFL